MSASTTLTPSERTLRASIAGHSSWAATTDRTARTQPGRDALTRKIEKELIAKIGETAWAAMTPAGQAKAVESARKAHFQRMAFKSVRARRRRARGGDDAAT